MNNTIKMPQRFDYSASGEFTAAFNALQDDGVSGKKIYLDCKHMDYIDSAGIGLLVMTHKRAQSHRNSVVIININASAKEILMLANLQKLIEIN